MRENWFSQYIYINLKFPFTWFPILKVLRWIVFFFLFLLFVCSLCLSCLLLFVTRLPFTAHLFRSTECNDDSAAATSKIQRAWCNDIYYCGIWWTFIYARYAIDKADLYLADCMMGIACDWPLWIARWLRKNSGAFWGVWCPSKATTSMQGPYQYNEAKWQFLYKKFQ